MKQKIKTLGQIWAECTETECKNKKDKHLCCVVLAFGGSQFGDDSCLKRLNKSKPIDCVENTEKK